MAATTRSAADRSGCARRSRPTSVWTRCCHIAWLANANASATTPPDRTSSIPARSRPAIVRADLSASPAAAVWTGDKPTMRASWRSSHWSYASASGCSAAAAAGPSNPASRSMSNVTCPNSSRSAASKAASFGPGASTLATSERGITAVRTDVARYGFPSATMACTATPWPTANSTFSRYNKSRCANSGSL
jgi:hypothetical protein